MNEIAAAIGDDPNFSNSLTTSLNNKLNISDFTTTADTWIGSGNLNKIGNVSNTTPINGQVLTYLNGFWYAGTVATAESQGAVMETDNTTLNMQFVIDEDLMVSNLDTKVPTQQSVKSYVDSKLNAVSGISLSNLPGNMDDITDGATYVRSQNNFTHSEKNKLAVLSELTVEQQGAVMEHDTSTILMGFVVDDSFMNSASSVSYTHLTLPTTPYV